MQTLTENEASDSGWPPTRNHLDKLYQGLTPAELRALLQLREDGRGNYDPALTRARTALERKGLADSPMTLGFGGSRGRFAKIASVQKPTELGLALQQHIERL